MLWAYSSASALIGDGEAIPFDKISCRTNDDVQLSEDGSTVSFMRTGWYIVGIEAVLSNSSTSAEITTGVRLYSENHEFPEGERIFDIPASGSAPLSVSVPVYVKPSSTGVAKVSWQITEQATVESAVLSIYRVA